jgi:hypothetical protein
VAGSPWTRAIAVASFPLAALGGCAINSGSGLSSAEARDSLYESLDMTEIALGGEWENRDDPTARGCVIPLWVEGEHYPGLRIGGSPSNVDRVVADVIDAWEDWGFHVERTLVGDIVELQGRDSVGELMIFRVSAKAMTLQGESECRPT